MARVAVQFVANSNMGALSKDLATINAQLAAMAGRLKETAAMNPRGFANIQRGFAASTNALAGFESQAMSTRSEVRKLTDELNSGKINMRGLKEVRKHMGQLVSEQRRLQDSMAMVGGTDINGRVQGQLVTPLKAYTNAAEEARLKTGILGKGLQSAGQELTKVGKQAQWTGRQLATGITLPLVALAGGAAKAAYDIDAAMTRLTKVYGDLNGASASTLEQVRKDTTDTAQQVAKQFGIAGKETVELGADLAAMGYQGADLQKIIMQTSRISTLGELDRVQSINLTRSAMSAFGISVDELGNKFNFLNAIENSTSTTTQDLAEAIPRVAGVVHDLGGSMEDAAIFTVAFRKAGYTAAQGSNALRSSLGAILNPSKQVNKQMLQMGIDVGKLRAQHPGDLMGQLIALGDELNKLGGDDRQKALATLFGRYQFGKMGSLLKSLTTDARTSGSEVAKAFEIAGASAEQLNDVAERELTQLQESVSGRIRRAAQSIVLEFAEMGRPILKVIATLMEGFSRFLELLNSAPSALKWSAVVVGGILAIAGPIMYIIGLAKAFGGTMLRLFGSLLMGKARFRELATGQSMFAKLANQSLAPIEQEEIALTGLNRVLQNSVASYMALAEAKGLANSAMGVPSTTPGTPAESGRSKKRRNRATRGVGAPGATPVLVDGMYHPAGYRAAVKPADTKSGDKARASIAEREAAAAAKTAVSEKDAADARAKSLARTQGIVSGVATIGSLLSASLLPAGKLANIFSTGFMVLAIFPQIITGIGRLLKTQILGKILEATGGTLKFAQMIAKARLAFAGMLGPIGLVLAAIAAIGITFWRQSKQVEKANNAMGDSAKNLAKQFGADWNEYGGRADEAANKVKDAQTAVEKFRDENKEAVKQLQEAYDPNNLEKVGQMLQDLGSEVFQHTGSAEAAQKAMDTAAKAINHSELSAKFSINFKNGEAAESAEAARVGRKMGKIASDNFETSWTENLLRGGKWNMSRIWGDKKLSGGAQQAARDIADEFATSMADGMDNVANRGKIEESIKDMTSQVNAMYQSRVGRFDINDSDARKLRANGVDPGDLTAVRQHLGLMLDGQAANSGYSKSLLEVRDKLLNAGAAERQMAARMIERLNLDPHLIDSTKGVAAVFAYLRQNYATVTDAQKEYNTSLQENARRGRVYSDNAKRLLAEEIIRKYNLKGVTAEQIMNNMATADAKGALEQAANAAGKYQEQLKALGQSLRGTSGEELQKAVDEGLRIFDEATEAGKKPYEDRKDANADYYDDLKKRSDKKFTDEKKKIDDAKKLELDAIDDRIKKEEDLDDLREKMFNREKTRLQRLADAANTNIDYNIAFNSGNLDEAAKIANNAYVTSISNSMDDALEDAPDRMKAINDKADKDRDKVESKYDTKYDDLDTRRDAARETLEDEKKAADERIENEQRVYERGRELIKKGMEERLRAIVSEGARSHGEFTHQMGRIGGVFDQNTRTLLQKSSVWQNQMAGGMAAAIDKSRAAMAADKKWEEFGFNVTQAMSRGAFGMDLDKALDYLATGKKPEGWEAPKAPPKATGPLPGQPGSALYDAQVPRAARHTGGPVDGTPGNRLGRTGALRRDEQAAILQHGEYVVNRSAVDALGVDTLHAINQGKMIGPEDGRYHSGGYVQGPALAFAAGLTGAFQDLMTTAIRRKDAELMAQGADASATVFGAPEVTGIGALVGPEYAKAVLAAIKQHESGGNYKSQSRISSASGAYQYIDGTWGGYGGYKRAFLAPPAIQDERAMKDLMNAYRTYNDWEKAVANHFYPAWAGRPDMWDQSPSAGNPTVRQYVDSIMAKAGIAAGAGAAGGYRGNSPYTLAGGTVTGDIQGLNTNFLQRLARWSDAVNQPYNVGSGYRSMAEQAKLYAAWKAGTPGQAKAAPPGMSNHNYGLASDGPHWGGLHPERFGLRYPMSYEPWHVEPVGAREMRVPALRTGGTVKFDNTLANLHKGEKVLTAPLSSKLERGINQMDNSSHPQYNISINGANANPDEIAKKVIAAIEKKERGIGINKKVKNP